MLTATYTLVALSVEQTNVRMNLQSLQTLLLSSLQEQQSLSAAQVESSCAALKHAYDSFHWRKLDKFLMPAVQGASALADALLHELDALSMAAAQAMTLAYDHADGAALDGASQVAAFRGAIDRCCANLLQRLEREEQELFPLARAVISGEAWFALANQMLAHDASQNESRGGLPSNATRTAFRRNIARTHRRGLALHTMH